MEKAITIVFIGPQKHIKTYTLHGQTPPMSLGINNHVSPNFDSVFTITSKSGYQLDLPRHVIL